MIQSPVMVGIASIVPGLGFVLLGRWKHALWIWLALFCMFALANFSPAGSFGEIFGIKVFFFIWFGQGVLAVQDARTKKAIDSGKLRTVKEISDFDAIVPVTIPWRMRGMYKIQKYVQAQCDFGEHVQSVIIGMTNTGYGIGTGQYAIGFTEKNLVILNMGAYGKPVSVEKFLLVTTKLKFKKGFLHDSVQIEIAGQKKPFQIYANWGIRKLTLEFVEKFPKEQLP